jgi:DNA-binding MarR family transcriptional regulator
VRIAGVFGGLAWVVLGHFEMDGILFGSKRSYWATVRFASARLRPFGVTPARMDMLWCIASRGRMGIQQSRLHFELGVSRATVSRMLRALEHSGWVERESDVFDRRTRACRLTPAGLALLRQVRDALVGSRVVPAEIDAALGDASRLRRTAEDLFWRLVVAFGRWGPMELPQRQAA